MNLYEFKEWLTKNTDYTKETVNDIVSRAKRADKILSWYNDSIYQFRLEEEEVYKNFSCSVRSQIKKAVKLYFEFEDYHFKKNIVSKKNSKDFGGKKTLSLFSNIGVSEAYFESIGVEVVVANELIENRAKLYSSIYPDTHMICGDITNKDVYDEIIDTSLENKVEFIIATPPCQGMSTAGQQNKEDERNKLICPVIDIIKQINPNYVFIENVPLFLNTKIEISGEIIAISDYIERELDDSYCINTYIIDTKNYSVPQTRERAIILMTKKSRKNKEWVIPEKDNKIVTMYDAIGHLPSVDPFVKDVDEKELLNLFPNYFTRKEEAEKISKWHVPPHHVKRQVIAMQHTPTGCTAFDNPVYYPIKKDGSAVRGYRNTYKRQNWKTAAYTVTMDNRKISSQNNVHPGRLELIKENGDRIYSDARALTLYELMTIMSLPKEWPVPENTSEAFLRRVIGEGIPPLFVKKVFQNLD